MFDIDNIISNNTWYSKIITPNGKVISGAAAFNHRIKLAGGINNLLLNVAFYAVKNTFDVLNQRQSLPQFTK